MPRCKPGDVCIVISGPSTGLSCTVLAHATANEAITYAYNMLGEDMLPDTDPGTQFWLIDKPVIWRGSTGELEDIEIPYECDDWLMPIGSKEKEKQTTKEAECSPCNQ